MCGIVGYSGAKNAADVILAGLSRLEYRGYDSAGMSLLQDGEILTIKSAGRLACLVETYGQAGSPAAVCGVGHTRWATHGAPSDKNSHPHGTRRLSLVHNGIIENYLQLKELLRGKGYAFESDTDTEVLAKLIDACLDEHPEPVAAIEAALEKVEGSFALAIVFAGRDGVLYAARRDSPLIVGLGDGENLVASDIPAILAYTRDYLLLEEGEIAVVKADSVAVLRDGAPVKKRRMTADWDVEQAQKAGFAHFMLKEIYEQPKALADTIHLRIQNGLPDFSDDGLPGGFFARYDKVFIVACGTAMHAGCIGKTLIEQFARLPVEVDVASEFRYRSPILTEKTLVIAISQSGETADTLAAVRLAKNCGADTLAIVNVAGSSIAREAGCVLPTYAGPEIAVASTKAFSVQIGILYLLAMRFALARGTIGEPEAKRLAQSLFEAIDAINAVLACDEFFKQLAPRFTKAESLFYLGRGVDYALAMEGSLKLKEISYIHSEAYAAGEIKHGTIALITGGVPVVGLVTQSKLLPKVISNIKEARARGGYVLLITKEGFEIDSETCDEIVRLPALDDIFMPLLSVIALQLFAYHIAVARGCDVDKPRNLAKSVTVE